MPSSSQPPLDINRQSELQLLPAGWHALEVDAGRPFRWVDNNAAFSLPPALNHFANISLDVEAGPGMGRQFFQLTIASFSYKQEFTVQDRQLLPVSLPLSRHQHTRFTLRADGGGYPCPNDDRQLNFRVFLLATPPDIVSLQSGVELLSGWGPLDTATAQPRRIALSGASLRCYSPRDFPVLAFDIEAGPSPAGLRIDLLDHFGRPVFTTAIHGRQLICARLHLPAGASGCYSLHFEWIGRHSLPPPILVAFTLHLH